VAAGVDVVIATPDGRVPRPDPWGLEPFFHYPQVDEDFMFSVLRRFAYHPDRVRVTFTHFSELNLVAIRRVYHGLLETGMEPAEARKAVESAAHRTWRDNRDFIEVLAGDDELTSRLQAMRIRQIRDAAPRCPASFRSMPTASNSSQKWADGPARLGSGHVVIDDGLGGQPVELGEFGMELTDLVLPPGRRAERVVGDRGQHEEPGVGRFQAQPFGAFHAGFLPSPGTIWIAPADGSLPAGQSAK
jgi:hypothetical protein